jgi:hypothetical protein
MQHTTTRRPAGLRRDHQHGLVHIATADGQLLGAVPDTRRGWLAAQDALDAYELADERIAPPQRLQVARRIIATAGGTPAVALVWRQGREPWEDAVQRHQRQLANAGERSHHVWIAGLDDETPALLGQLQAVTAELRERFVAELCPRIMQVVRTGDTTEMIVERLYGKAAPDNEIYTLVEQALELLVRARSLRREKVAPGLCYYAVPPATAILQHEAR